MRGIPVLNFRISHLLSAILKLSNSFPRSREGDNSNSSLISTETIVAPLLRSYCDAFTRFEEDRRYCFCCCPRISGLVDGLGFSTRAADPDHHVLRLLLLRSGWQQRAAAIAVVIDRRRWTLPTCAHSLYLFFCVSSSSTFNKNPQRRIADLLFLAFFVLPRWFFSHSLF
ncbi:hypothetical protein L596_006492 [Steinernema carpocapsae]|uniref:Uncharacterized protein n=1 Tax=Steinernema carpocapsae TaxID=34508 RepID=A0A4U8V4C4_STECR|nr:hypothetical protein L596_006492 [Steinernema carpocapsae]